jgi:hypothetical protein
LTGQGACGAQGHDKCDQPAQKWLKDRKARALTLEDAKHYRRILKILSETDRIMQTITMAFAVALLAAKL